MAFKLTREFHIPKGSVKVAQRNGDGVVYLYSTASRFGVVAFHGTRSTKPDFHFTYKNEKAREKSVAEFFASRKARVDAKATRTQKPRDLNVGDIVYASWGYDQTNIDFYEVVGLKGTTTVMLRKVKQKIVNETGWASENVVARPGEYCDEPIERRCRGTSVRIDDIRYAGKWDGRPLNQTHYH